jgi:hypothetical protein
MKVVLLKTQLISVYKKKCDGKERPPVHLIATRVTISLLIFEMKS